MAILNFLPEFKIVEINRSTGLVAGHVLAQFPLADDAELKVTYGGVDYLENGFIVGLGSDLELAPFDSTKHAQPLLVFTEELNTFFDGLKWYATMEDEEDGIIYPRALGLFVGDAFTTNNYDVPTGVTAPKFAKVEDGVLTLQATATGDTLFAVEESTLPTNEDAYRFIFVGEVA
jgi:uncharacterized protein YneR